MIRALTRTTLLIALLAGASAAGATAKIDDVRKAEITAAMTAQGYEVRKIKTEDGLYEVYALKDGKKLEVYLDDALNIVRTKEQD
jgi:hypothetical protein